MSTSQVIALITLCISTGPEPFEVQSPSSSAHDRQTTNTGQLAGPPESPHVRSLVDPARADAVEVPEPSRAEPGAETSPTSPKPGPTTPEPSFAATSEPILPTTPEPILAATTDVPRRRASPPAKVDNPAVNLPPTGLDGARSSPEFIRRGPSVGMSLGLANCAQPDCFDIVVAGLGRLEFGYRWGIPALVVGASAGGAKLSLADDLADLEGSALIVNASAGLKLFPVRSGRVDPFIVTTLGYHRMRWRLSDGDLAAQAWYSRAAFRLGAGLDIFVSNNISFGPRFDYTWPFGGQLCFEDPGMSKECAPVSNQLVGTDAFEMRAAQRSIPKLWAATLNVHIRFP